MDWWMMIAPDVYSKYIHESSELTSEALAKRLNLDLADKIEAIFACVFLG